MREIDWKTKLTSRKFWACVCEFVTMLILAFHGTQETATQIAALIMAGAGVVAYIIGEGMVDAGRTVIHLGEFQGDKPPDGDGEE